MRPPLPEHGSVVTRLLQAIFKQRQPAVDISFDERIECFCSVADLVKRFDQLCRQRFQAGIIESNSQSVIHRMRKFTFGLRGFSNQTVFSAQLAKPLVEIDDDPRVRPVEA